MLVTIETLRVKELFPQFRWAPDLAKFSGWKLSVKSSVGTSLFQAPT